MPAINYRYAFDRTGTNPDNKVVDEPHVLNNLAFRSVAPTYGPFFAESVYVYDVDAGRPLVKDIDYFPTEILEELSLKLNKEISSLIIINNSNVSNNIKITYQTVGGIYSDSSEAVSRMFEVVMNDSRTVNWENVEGKPYAYPPNLHFNYLTDIVGFEPLITALERIRNAIIVSDVPAWEALIDWVKKYVAQRQGIVTEQEIDTQSGLDKLVSHERLLYALKTLHFNTFLFEPDAIRIRGGNAQLIGIRSTNIPDNTRLYWTIGHTDTTPADFSTDHGSFVIYGNRSEVLLNIIKTKIPEKDEKFKLQIRMNAVNGPVIAESSYYTIMGETPKSNSMAAMLLSCCLYNPAIKLNAKHAFISRELCHTQLTTAQS